MTAILAFGFVTAGRIRFGRGTAAEAPTEVLALGRRVMVLHGRDAARAAWLIDALRAGGADVLGHACLAEPDLDALAAATAAARDLCAEVVVGLGGGAALDLAKAVAALVHSPGTPLDHLEVVGAGRPLDHPLLPFVALPTTAGTGAEVTRNAVIGVPAHRRKVSLRDDRMLARLALVDPALTDGTPLPVTLACGLDALTQVIEPYVSSRATPLTDALCRDAIPRGLTALVRLMDGEDAAARDAMAYVGLAGGLALTNAALGAVHGFAGVIGGLTGGAHGAICGGLLPHVMAANLAAATPGTPAWQRLAEVGATVEAVTGGSLADLVARCYQHGLPHLGTLGLTGADLPAVAAASRVSSSMKGNPVDPAVLDLKGLLHAAIGPPQSDAEGKPRLA